jgi:hypothetical protein
MVAYLLTSIRKNSVEKEMVAYLLTSIRKNSVEKEK